MPNTTQFERQPYSITSYSVNSGLTEWIKTSTYGRIEIKLYSVTNLHIEIVFVVNNDWKQKLYKRSSRLLLLLLLSRMSVIATLQSIDFKVALLQNRVQPFGTAGSPNLNMVGLIVVPFQLVVFLMLVLQQKTLLHIQPRSAPLIQRMALGD